MFGLATVFPTHSKRPMPASTPVPPPPPIETEPSSPPPRSPSGSKRPAKTPIEAEVKLKAFAERIRTSDYFAILGVAPDADAQEIREAHRALRFDLRLDELARSPDLLEIAREVRRALDEARDVLLVPELRAKYQQHLKPRTS
jgi:hypothetical protein